MARIDPKTAPLYRAGAAPALIEVPPRGILAVDGAGDPNTAPAYAQALEALYTLSYTLKFALKAAGGPDYGVLPLEGLWWTDDPRGFTAPDKSGWHWTALIAQPPEVTPALVETCRAAAQKRKPGAALDRVRFETWAEGRAAQLLHTGPYAEEGPSIARLHAFIAAQGLRLTGRHHEIYLSDPRRTAPARLKTILRQPVTDG